MKDNQVIQISRNQFIESDRHIALVKLEEKEFHKGEFCSVSYYNDSSNYKNEEGKSIESVLAIGIKDGKGRDCYRIVSLGGEILVDGVLDEVPDVSSLVHEELFIAPDVDGALSFVYKEGDNRVIKKIEKGPYIFNDSGSGYRWFYNNQTCRREDQFLSSNDIDKVIQEYANIDCTLKVSILNGNLFAVGQVKDVILEIEVLNKAGENVNSKCDFYLGGEKIELTPEGRYTVKSVSESEKYDVEARYIIREDSGLYLSFFEFAIVEFGYNYYFGPINEEWTGTAEEIQNLSGKSLNTGKDYCWDRMDITNQRVAFCYPVIYGYLQHIFDDNGLDYISSYKAEDLGIVVGGTDYIVYTSLDPLNVTNFKQHYSFIDSEREEQSLERELITSWRLKNRPSGLVVLGTDGKIPGELLDTPTSDDKVRYLLLKDMVEVNPESGEIGDIYYNVVSKRIIRITSSGVVEEIPKNDAIYSFKNIFYYWNGEDIAIFSEVQTRKVESIDEIYK